MYSIDSYLKKPTELAKLYDLKKSGFLIFHNNNPKNTHFYSKK